MIDTAEDLAEGSAHLAGICPVWARILPQLGPLPLRRRPDGFEAIASAIVGLGIGYWIQRSLDKRIPWVALGGVGLVATGAVIKTRWSIRGSLIVGGGMLAAGSTVYVFTAEGAPALSQSEVTA